ncbi:MULTISPECIES: DUF2958 domain-containing protein [unclassified Bradyrhizobium]|uniref:DUF2958 domain-containing protein n=1 Tax=unclassified Bradyrhizobium TaxID=2631580 RepID=UPI002916A693|nr:MULTISPECIES: DUF2958 domain-containing protein [unclassified Bradyrhizobium]
MKVLFGHYRPELVANGLANFLLRSSGLPEEDFKPVVKLFCPWGPATWLLTEIDPEDPDIACGLGMGCPELGNVSLSELASVIGPGGLTIERDVHFEADKPLSAYAEEARLHQRIIA